MPIIITSSKELLYPLWMKGDSITLVNYFQGWSALSVIKMINSLYTQILTNVLQEWTNAVSMLIALILRGATLAHVKLVTVETEKAATVSYAHDWVGEMGVLNNIRSP